MWPDPESDAAWKQNVKDIDGELLCVSQFTLMANTVKGNKPDYHRAMASDTTPQQLATHRCFWRGFVRPQNSQEQCMPQYFKS